MEHTDIERTDNSSVAFLKGWAEAFPEQEWIAGADLRNSPPKPPAVRLKAAKQGWSGSPGKAGASLADSYDIHLECSVDKSGRPLGWLKLHVETLPYNLENQIGCNPNSGSSDCEACRRREAARQRFAALGSDGIGGWEKPSGSGKLLFACVAVTVVIGVNGLGRVFATITGASAVAPGVVLRIAASIVLLVAFVFVRVRRTR
jgi:hypothetical protein